MADEEENDKKRRARRAAVMRARRAAQAASRMAKDELIAKLMFVEQEKKILENELTAKLSCQQESLPQAALASQGPPTMSWHCVTPPRSKTERSPTLGSGNGRNKLQQHEKMSMPPTLPPDEVTPDKVTPSTPSPQVAPSSQRSLPSPLSVIRFLHAVEKVRPTHSTCCALY